MNPTERIPFSGVSDWKKRIRRNLETLAAQKLDAVSLDRFYQLTADSVLILEPFLNVFSGGWAQTEVRDGTLRATLSTPLFFPEPSLQLPENKGAEERGILPVIRRCLYETAALGNTPDRALTLSDGLLHFGILKGTGYYWSLSDHRNRLRFHENPHTFDELSRVIPTEREESLKNLKLVYDNNRLELTLCVRLPQEEE